MAEEGLKIKVGADVQGAVTSMNTLNASLNKTNQTAANLGSTGMAQLSKSTGQANTALINFGRVVQDAPFGIIGIANNIDPLVLSFQNLKRETGSNAGAFKALASSLAGPAGVGIAVSAVTSLLIVLGPKISDYLSGVTNFQKGLNDATKEGLESFKKSEFEFGKLSRTINDSTNSSARQKDALEKVNNQLSEYGIKINDVASFQKNSSLISSIYIQIKQKEATATALATVAAQEYAKQLDVQRNLARSGSLFGTAISTQNPLLKLFASIKASNAAGDLKDIANDQKAFNNEINNLNVDIDKLINQLKTIPGVTEDFNKKTSKGKSLQENVNELLSDYRNTLKSISYEEQIKGIDKSNQRLETNLDFLKRAADLVGFTGQAYKTINKDTKEFADAAASQKLLELIKNYKIALNELDIKESVTGQDQLNSRINLTIDALVELKKSGKENTEQYAELQNTLNNLKAEVGLREIRKRQQEIAAIWSKYRLQADKLEFNKTKTSLDIVKGKIDLITNTIQDLKGKGLTEDDLGIKFLEDDLGKLLEQFKVLQEQKQIFDALRSAIEGGLTNAFSSVFEAIAEGENIFKALGNSIKRLILDLIKVVIQMTVVKAITNAILPGVGGQIAGQAAGSFIRSDMLRLSFGR